jgi:hypothetical protein
MVRPRRATERHNRQPDSASVVIHAADRHTR